MSTRKSKRKTRWTREFKLRALSRMDETMNVTALAEELGVRRESLYVWARAYRAGGSQALNPLSRPLNLAGTPEGSGPSSPASGDTAQRRIEELERKIGQQQLDLDFFRAALRQVREQRPIKGAPGETASTR